ncbi:MAG: thioredoxin [Endomicrobiales bacterium]|jgi:thioredoxin
MELLTNEMFKTKVFDYSEKKQWAFKGDLPCIIDFYADWCGPCKMVSPILEEIQKLYAGKIHVYKVDTDKEQTLASQFGVSSIPSILFVPKEGKPQMAVGAMSKEGFEEAIGRILNVK